VHTTRWLDLLFGNGDDDYAFWLLTVRINILVVVLCAALLIAWNLSPTRLRRARAARAEIGSALALTALAALLRFGVTSANLMDYGGVAYSRLLYGYKGYFGTAQFFSLFYTLTTRDIEHAILLNRIAGTLTVPLVYSLCRRLQPGAKLFPAAAAFLFAVYPLHVLFSASDALAIFSDCLAAGAYALLAGAVMLEAGEWVAAIRYVGGFAGLALLTQVRYENVLLLVPAAVLLLVQRQRLRWRPLIVALAVSATLVLIYGYEAGTSTLSYRDPFHFWPGLQMAVTHLVRNPLLAVPVLCVSIVAVWIYKGFGWGVLAVLPWGGAVLLSALTDTGHSAARVYANWLILILPCAGYGFSLMLSAPQRLAKTVAAAALVYHGLQPVLVRDRLAARHLEMLEHERFAAVLRSLPPDVRWIIVPDDELIWRRSRSTLELYTKYAMILEGTADAARRRVLVGLTEFLEQPKPTMCTPGTCVFFFGLPCMEPDTYPVSSAQCQELLRTHATSIVDQTSVVAAPFVDCGIYTGTLREQLCDPAIKLRRFVVYQVEE